LSQDLKSVPFVVKTDDKYPQDVKFEMVKNKNAEKDMTNVLDKFAVGQIRLNLASTWHAGMNTKTAFTSTCYAGKSSAEESQESKPAPKSDESEGDTPF
jgi:hypothetical protein